MLVVSYNTDNPKYSRKQHPDRLCEILDQVLSTNADVICLQEVELSVENKKTFFVEELEKAGYEVATHFISKSRSNHMGNLTASRTHITEIVRKSSCLLVVTNGLRIANVHCKCGLRSGIEIRRTQLKSTRQLNPDIIVGDFNTDSRELSRQMEGYITHDVLLTCENGGTWFSFDWLFVKEESNAKLEADTIHSDFSDHLMLVTKLTFK